MEDTKYGYQRVSTDDQTPALQLAALKAMSSSGSAHARTVSVGLTPKALLTNDVERNGDHFLIAAEPGPPNDFLLLRIHLPTDAKLYRAAGSQ
jgi:hypothetical protein